MYLDYNATSPVRPEVRTALEPVLGELFGNPSSLHAYGQRGRAAVESVRTQLLRLLGDPKGQIVFTSGGTEADNLALKGIARAMRGKGDHLIFSSIEHPAVIEAARVLRGEGFRLTELPVDGQGIVDLQALEQGITPKTVLISVMHANNEVGTIQPIEEVGRIARSRGVLFHTDAVQSFGKLPLNLQALPADLVSISGHKLGGVKGAGALYLRQGTRIEPLLHGGPHERNLRAGTEPVPAIVALGAAANATFRERENGGLDRIRALRNRLEEGLRERIPDLELNGHPVQRLAGTVNLAFLGCDGETLLMGLDLVGICVSTGSACASGSTEPSHVLSAMKLPPERIRGSIRFSLGWATTEREIEEALERIPAVVERVRKNRVGNRG